MSMDTMSAVRCPDSASQSRRTITRFKWLVFTKGQRSNGVGPSQLTFKGFFTDMESRVSSRTTCTTLAYGVKLIEQYYRDGRDQVSVNDALRYAGTRYNGSSAYGDSLLIVAFKWKARVDYA